MLLSKLAHDTAVGIREYIPPASRSSSSTEANETGRTQVIVDLLDGDAGEKLKAASCRHVLMRQDGHRRRYEVVA